MSVIYISHPFSADTDHGIQRNILAASEFALDCFRAGYTVICPHKNCAGYQNEPFDIDWYAHDLVLLDRCDAILMCGDWTHSRGCLMEYEYAEEHGIPIYEYLSQIINSREIHGLQ